MLSNETAGIIFQCLGGIAIGVFVWTLYRQSRIAKWPTAMGEILESSVIKDSDHNDEPAIRYQYTIRAITYVNDRIYPHGIVASSGSYAQRLVGKYPSGKKVKVRYNPDKPNDSALETQLPVWVPVLQAVAGLVFVIMGAMVKNL